MVSVWIGVVCSRVVDGVAEDGVYVGVGGPKF